MSAPDQTNREKEIFEGALDHAPGEERRRFLESACGDDGVLLARIQALLCADDAGENFLPEQPRESRPIITEKPGDQIGPYRLLQQIGEGGCGVVYMAEQQEPVRRRVALKIIKAGMDTRSVIARFEAERQALALMDHMNIAKVLEAGATAAGRPYFVMELVGGAKITDYCEQNHLTTRARLDLFIQVCRAIQHAHQKGIIHRDIKPSNVLVAIQDGVAVPKVIDFGIAKATEGRLTDNTVFTAFEQFLGTPAYMSPEQAQLGGLDVDTRSDIYSLGVLLYELLTGKTPFDAKELLAAGLEAMRRTIQEKEPPTPSTRLSQELVAASQESVSELAEGDGSTLMRRHYSRLKESIVLVKGDLDWIVMKSLEKDRRRRYETANGLARDIERHLSNEPVVASPPSRVYRFQKAVRRNRSAWLAAAIVTVVLLTGVVVTTWQAVVATLAKKQALIEKHRADEEAAKQEAINRFLNDMLASADPYSLSPLDQAKGPNITMVEVLDAAVREVAAGSLKDRPAIEAAICQTLGSTYGNLNQIDKAEPFVRKALELNRQLYGEQSDNAINALNEMAGLRGAQGRLEEQETLLQQVLTKERELHGKEHLHVASALLNVARNHYSNARGRYGSPSLGGVKETYREALTMQRKLLPSESPILIPTLFSLASFLTDLTFETREATDLLKEALRIQISVSGRHHPSTASIMSYLATVLSKGQEHAEAKNLCIEAIAIQRTALGTNHPAYAESICSLAMLLQRENKLAEAEDALRELVRFHQQENPRGLALAYWRRALAENLLAQKHYEQAEIVYKEALKFWETGRLGGLGSEPYRVHFDGLIDAMRSERKFAEMETLYCELLQRQRETLGETNVAVLLTMCDLAGFLVSQNKPEEAEQLCCKVIEHLPKLGLSRDKIAIRRAAHFLFSRGKYPEATSLYEQSIRIESENPGGSTIVLGQLRQDFGDLLWGDDKFEAAAVQYLKALPLRRAALDENLIWTLRNLGGVLIECSRVKEAELHLRESLDVHRSFAKEDHLYCTAWAGMLLAEALFQQGKLPESEKAYTDSLAAYRNCNALGGEGYDQAVRGLFRVLIYQQKLVRAQSILKQVLADERSALGPKDVRPASTLILLAKCLQLQSASDHATNCLQEALGIIANSPSENLLHFPPAMIAMMVDLGLGRQAEELCDRVLKLVPATNAQAFWLNDASWSLTLAEESGAHEPSLAIQLAKRAAELQRGNYDHMPRLRLALGAALYRAGDGHGAVAEIERALGNEDGNILRRDLFFLAMAHHRVGDPESARRIYKQAADWMTEHSPCQRELIHLRAEAEALLAMEAPRSSQVPSSH